MSSRRLPVELSRKAARDFDDLLMYSFNTWGARQKNIYKAAIDRALRRISNYPEIGRQRDDLPGDYRSIPVEQHHIFYRIETDTVRVIRILHGRMDASAALAEAESL